jgi:probable HAF family extracellular repeat protein
MGAVVILLAILATAGWNGGAVMAAVEYEFFLIEAFEVDYDLREVILRDINESAHVTGTSTNEGFYDGFVWTPSNDKVIIPLVWPRGINNRNQVVGGGLIYDFDNGETIHVPPVGGWPIPSLQAINDSGIAVGYSECACSNSDRTLQDAMVWDLQHGSRTIPVAGAKELLQINNGNGAVGNIRGGGAGSEGFFYNVDTGAHVNMTDLLPPYMNGRGWSELQDLSEANVVAGRGWDGQFIRGLTWSQDSGFTFLPPIPGGVIDRVYPRGINTSGTVVGFADLTPHDPRAFVWDPEHGMRNLNDLVEAPANFILDWAIKINDQGWIIGIGHYGPYWGTSRGFVLRPTASAGVDEGIEDIAARRKPELQVLVNPVAERLALRFSLSQVEVARLSIFDVAGRQIARVLDATVPAGVHTVLWDPIISQASGVYYARLEVQGWVDSKRFVLVR